MATKTITIRKDVYDKLRSLKRPGESFSDELDRLTETGDVMELAGAWSDVREETIREMHDTVDRTRRTRRDDL